METNKTLSKVFLIMLSLFIVMLGYGILLPILPYYTERLALKSGLDTDLINFHIGLLTSVYPLFQLLFVIVWGRLSDKYGRKPILICGLIGFIIMQFLTGLATSLTMLYVARIFGGIFTSSVIPVSNAYLSDITSEKNRTKIMAWSGFAISSGIIFGPTLGGLLSQTNVHLNYSFGQFHLDRFSVPFFIAAVLGSIVLFSTIKWLKSPKNKDALFLKIEKNHLSFSRYFIVLLLLSFVMQFVITLFETVFSIYGKDELSFTSKEVGIGFMLCGLVMAVLQPFFAAYGNRIMSVKQLIGFGLLISGLSLIAFPFFSSTIYIFMLIIFFAIGGAMITPILLSRVSLISKINMGRNISIQASANSIGQIIGPILGTWSIAGSFYFPFIMAGLILIIAIGLLLFIRKNYQIKCGI